MVDLSCRLGGITVDPCIMNIPGLGAITFEELAAIGKSRAGAIVTAAMTIEPQKATPEPNYHDFGTGSVSSAGFPNLGCKAYGEMIADLKRFGKPVVATITGGSLEEFLEAANAIAARGPDFLLVDLTRVSAPTPYYQFEKRLVGYRFDLVEAIVSQVKKIARQPVGMFQPSVIDLPNMAAVAGFVKSLNPAFVVLLPPINVGMVIDAEAERSVLNYVRSGVGRLAGAAMKPLALAKVRVVAQHLAGAVPIVGCGGVTSGKDVFEYLLCGATAVQVGTAFVREGPAVFAKQAEELSGLMGRKGYRAASDVIGKIKSWN